MLQLDRNTRESRALGWIRLPLAALIVLLHTAYTEDKTDFGYVLGKCVMSNIVIIAVPLFFFISGYLFFAKYEKYGMKEYVAMLKKKTFALLIPYLIWNFISYYVYGLRTGFTDEIRPWELYRIFWCVSDGYTAMSPFGYRFSLLNSPYHGALWFVRDLMVVMVCSPVIWWIIRRCKMWSLLIFLIPWVFRIGIPIDGFGYVAFCFFPLGAAFSICGKNVFRYIDKVGGAILCVYIGILILAGYLSYSASYGRQLGNMLIVIGGMSLLVVAYRFCNGKYSDKIILYGEASFLIYVLHTMFIFLPLRFVIDPIKEIPYIGNTCAYLSMFSVRVVLCICIYFIWKKYSPRTLSVASGGRSLINHKTK